MLLLVLKTDTVYFAFSFMSLSAVITHVSSYIFFQERAGKIGWMGINLALLTIPLLSYQDPEDTPHSLGLN